MRRDITMAVKKGKAVGYSDSNNTPMSELMKLYDNDLDTYLEYNSKLDSYIQITNISADMTNSVVVIGQGVVYFGLSQNDVNYKWFAGNGSQLEEYTTRNYARVKAFKVTGERVFNLPKGIISKYMRMYMVGGNTHQIIELDFIKGKSIDKINKLEQRIAVLETQMTELVNKN